MKLRLSTTLLPTATVLLLTSKSADAAANGSQSSVLRGSVEGAAAVKSTDNRAHRKLKKENKKVGGSEGRGLASVPGVSSDVVLLAADINYPPYAQLGSIEDDAPLSGFGPDLALSLSEVCPALQVEVTQANWGEDCWGSNVIGEGLKAGRYHGCMTYTHTGGVRNRYMEFSSPILSDNKAAGILTRLENGVPVIDGNSDLSGVKVADVVGWAPTADNLAIVTNKCTGEPFAGYELISPDGENDGALQALLDGTVDAVWIYTDQAENYSCANTPEPDEAAWDCSLWDGLGTDFAFVQTGIFEWSVAGTTLSMSKKGSGVPEVLNPCIEAFLETESYYDLCVDYNLVNSCFSNDFFPAGEMLEEPVYNLPTNELTTDCSEGYCSCPSS